MTILYLRGYLPNIIKNPKIYYDRPAWASTIKVFYLLNEIITFYYHETYKNQTRNMKKNQKKYIFPCKK